MRIALLSNVTVEVLAGMLKREHSLWLPPGFGAWIETALNPPADMIAFNPEAIFLLLDSSHASYEADAVNMVKTALESRFQDATVFVPDLDDLAVEVGSFYDEGMWRLGSMPWSMNGLRAIKEDVNRFIRAMKGERKKVLALDFDNTIWSGVIGEDGVSGVAPFVGFQRGIKALRERGVLLVALTKNNLSDVEPIWEDPRMVLKRDDFAAFKIDWNDKPANIISVAREMNLGLDSFVFIDDNPAERAQMKAVCPEVVVPEFPAAEADLSKFIRSVTRLYFPEMRLTDEDRRKTVQYQEEAKRREFASGLSVDDYLKGLGIWADVHQLVDSEIPRIAQLSQKTNQFNVRTNRYTTDQVKSFSSDSSRLLVAVRSGDRFGDQGLVAFVQTILDGDTATIIDWVMSCRAMNKRLEFAVESELEEMLVQRGVGKVFASWRRTLKNAPVENLFDSFGFAVVDASTDEKKYVLDLPRIKPLEHSFQIKIYRG